MSLLSRVGLIKNMKKEYIAPEMEVMEIENEAMMLTVSAPGEGGLEGTGSGGSMSGGSADSNKRRGTWGNLWD